MSADRICPLTGDRCFCVAPFERSCKDHAIGFGRYLASLETANISSQRKKEKANEAWREMIGTPLQLAVKTGASISDDMRRQMDSWAEEEKQRILGVFQVESG